MKRILVCYFANYSTAIRDFQYAKGLKIANIVALVAGGKIFLFF